MAHLGHPVLGDTEYFGEVALPPFPVGRQMLHSGRIGFETTFAVVPPPADFEAILETLNQGES